MNEERRTGTSGHPDTQRHAKPANSTCASLQDQNKLNGTGALVEQPIAAVRHSPPRAEGVQGAQPSSSLSTGTCRVQRRQWPPTTLLLRIQVPLTQPQTSSSPLSADSVEPTWWCRVTQVELHF